MNSFCYNLRMSIHEFQQTVLISLSMIETRAVRKLKQNITLQNLVCRFLFVLKLRLICAGVHKQSIAVLSFKYLL